MLQVFAAAEFNQRAAAQCEGPPPVRPANSIHTYSECKKSRIVTLRLARGDREWSLNDGQIPNFHGVRVHVSTGYNRVEANRRASRNGRVSDQNPKPLPSRFATCSSLGGK
jgi:hypothetical protein